MTVDRGNIPGAALRGPGALEAIEAAYTRPHLNLILEAAGLELDEEVGD